MTRILIIDRAEPWECIYSLREHGYEAEGSPSLEAARIQLKEYRPNLVIIEPFDHSQRHLDMSRAVFVREELRDYGAPVIVASTQSQQVLSKRFGLNLRVHYNAYFQKPVIHLSALEEVIESLTGDAE